jgi:hypothetical protein
LSVVYGTGELHIIIFITVPGKYQEDTLEEPGPMHINYPPEAKGG